MPKTLRGLFVLMTCIAVALALLIPAVYESREAARRMSCTNNMRQLGLAVHNYESAYKKLPAAFLRHSQLSWTVSIQPYMEASPLYSIMNHSAGPYYQVGKNDPHGLLEIWGYRCPSSSVKQMQLGPPHDVSLLDLVPPNTGAPPFTIHYYGISGPLGPRPDRSGEEFAIASDLLHEGVPVAGSGVFQWNSPVTFRSVIDGMSNTLCFGEMSWESPRYGTRYRSWLHGGTDGSYVAGCRNIVRPMNSHRQAAVIQPFNNMPMGSQHGGGANFTFVDGSVQFLSQSIDFPTYQIMASRKDMDP